MPQPGTRGSSWTPAPTGNTPNSLSESVWKSHNKVRKAWGSSGRAGRSLTVGDARVLGVRPVCVDELSEDHQPGAEGAELIGLGAELEHAAQRRGNLERPRVLSEHRDGGQAALRADGVGTQRRRLRRARLGLEQRDDDLVRATGVELDVEEAAIVDVGAVRGHQVDEGVLAVDADGVLSRRVEARGGGGRARGGHGKRRGPD